MQAILDAIVAITKLIVALVGSVAVALIEALALIISALVEALLTILEGLRQLGVPNVFGAAPYQPGTTLRQAWDAFRPLWQDLARWVFQD